MTGTSGRQSRRADAPSHRLAKPGRSPIPTAIDAELRRVFDICHGCRRCFNLCDSFPRLFDLIDASPTEELDGVESKDFGPVVDACTLCDMCFMTKCPYVPPHEFDLDFPHLMLRARAAEFQRGEVGFVRQASSPTPTATASWATTFSGLANWALQARQRLTRPLMEKVCRHPPRRRAARLQRRPDAGRRSQGRRARRPTRRAGLWPQGGDLRDLLCQLQRRRRSARRRAACSPTTGSRPRSSIRPAAACRCWSRATWPR